MKRLALVLLPVLPLLAACHRDGPAADDTSPRAQCAREVDADPRMVDLRGRLASPYDPPMRIRQEMDELQHKLEMDCELRHGLAPIGGVEKPRTTVWY